MQFLKDGIYKWNIIDKGSLEFTSTGLATTPMIKGQAAFTIITPYLLPVFSRPSETNVEAGNIDVMLMPESRYIWTRTVALSITKACMDKGQEYFDAAWEVLSYYGGKEMRKYFTKTALLSPPYKDFYDDPDVQDAYREHVSLNVLRNQEENYAVEGETFLVPVERQPWWLEFRDEYFIDNIHAAIADQKPVDQAFADIAEGLEALKAKHGVY
jgi:ABC-type glycerol-3-phosphate transport system substrate-binding protein